MALLYSAQCIVVTDRFTYTDDSQISKWYFKRKNDPSNKVVWTGQHVLLTTPVEYGRVGALYLRLNLTQFDKWQVDFIYFMSNSTDPYPAYGLSLNFYRNPHIGATGEGIGYSGVPGYAVECDTYVFNPGDPPIPTSLLPRPMHATTSISLVEGLNLRNRWMYTRVIFTALGRNSTHVYGRLQVVVWDGADKQTLKPLGNVLVNSSYTGWFKIYGNYLGFSAATGGQRDAHALWWARIETCTAPVGGVVRSPA